MLGVGVYVYLCACIYIDYLWMDCEGNLLSTTYIFAPF